VSYIGKIIEYNDKITELESDFSPGCRGRIVDYRIHVAGTPDEHVEMIVDIHEFVEFNKDKWEANYYDKNHNPCLKFIETSMFPANHRVSDYQMTVDVKSEKYFKFIDEPTGPTEDEKKEMQEITESIYWQMLMEIESHCKQDDVFNKMLVKGAYNHWNKLHPEGKAMIPRWEQK
jgi:hypothetical protein